MDGEDTVFHSEALYGAKTDKPLVKLTMLGKSMMVTTKDAKKIAYDILDTAHASDGDGFMVHWLRDKLKVDEQRLWGIMTEFREDRVRMNGED